MWIITLCLFYCVRTAIPSLAPLGGWRAGCSDVQYVIPKHTIQCAHLPRLERLEHKTLGAGFGLRTDVGMNS
jgi:hypothetical protein